jgi:deleted-in-malignant-brain-tumors protein 1
VAEIKVRLNGTSTNYQGRVEVKYVGVWGTIDDDGWDILDASVVCRQLGFAGAISAFTGSLFGRGKGPVWFSNVQCNGNETGISQCIYFNNKKSTSSSMNPNAEAGVECYGKYISNKHVCTRCTIQVMINPAIYKR